MNTVEIQYITPAQALALVRARADFAESADQEEYIYDPPDNQNIRLVLRRADLSEKQCKMLNNLANYLFIRFEPSKEMPEG